MDKLIIGKSISFNSKPYIVLASKEQPLTEEVFEKLKFKPRVANIEKIVKNGLTVTKGFDLLIGEILHSDKNGHVVLGSFSNVFYGDISLDEED
jgi:hypothetical protein